MSSENSVENSRKENETSGFPELWKLLAGCEASSWRAGSFHQTQPRSWRNNSWDRDDATGPLISATPVLFVCGQGEGAVVFLGVSWSGISVPGRPTRRGPSADLGAAPACFAGHGLLPPQHPPSCCPLKGKRSEMQSEETHVGVRISCNTTEVAFQTK